MTEAVTSAETQAGQIGTWLRQPGRHVWNDLHRAHREAAAAFVKLWGPALIDAIASVVDRSPGAREVTLVYPDQSPGRVYALNRFLCVLLLEYFDYVSAVRADFFGTTPSPVTPTGGAPRVLLLKEHKLDVQQSFFDSRTSEYTVAITPNAGGSLVVVVDELFVRHGIRKAPPLTVRVGLHEVGVELGRIKLPYVAAS